MKHVLLCLICLLPLVTFAQDPQKEVRTVYFTNGGGFGLLSQATEDVAVYNNAVKKHWFFHKLNVKGDLKYGNKKFRFRGATYMLRFGKVDVIKLQ